MTYQDRTFPNYRVTHSRMTHFNVSFPAAVWEQWTRAGGGGVKETASSDAEHLVR